MKRWIPTPKWTAATIQGLGALGVAWAQAGHWSSTLTVVLVGLVTQRLVAYAVPNHSDRSSWG